MNFEQYSHFVHSNEATLQRTLNLCTGFCRTLFGENVIEPLIHIIAVYAGTSRYLFHVRSSVQIKTPLNPKTKNNAHSASHLDKFKYHLECFQLTDEDRRASLQNGPTWRSVYGATMISQGTYTWKLRWDPPSTLPVIGIASWNDFFHNDHSFATKFKDTDHPYIPSKKRCASICMCEE